MVMHTCFLCHYHLSEDDFRHMRDLKKQGMGNRALGKLFQVPYEEVRGLLDNDSLKHSESCDKNRIKE